MIRVILLMVILSFGRIIYAHEPEYDHVFFDNSLMSGSYYYSEVEYTSPSFVQNIKKKLPITNDEFFTAKNSLVLNYLSASNGSWDVSVIYPEWRGKDFIKKGDFLDLRILFDAETSLEELPLIAIGSNHKSDYLPLGNYIDRNNKINGWYLMRIPLHNFKNISYNHTKEIKKIFFKQAVADGKNHTVYIDQIELSSRNQNKQISATPDITVKAYERHSNVIWDKAGLENVKYIKIYRSCNGETFEAVGIQDPKVGLYADFSDRPNTTFQYKITCVGYDYKETVPSNIVEVSTHYMTDDELLTMVHEATFRYYWDGAEKISGLALENISGRSNMIATGASGFGIMGIISGVERGFITRQQAVERLKKIVSFLKKAETFHGAYSHFIDGSTGKVEPFFGKKDNGADLVETSFLFQGLLTARQFFDKNTPDEEFIRNVITQLWENIEWDWFKQTKDSRYLYWHWSPDQGWIINHKLIGWNETMITYLLAIASPTHGVDKDLYYSGWASQEPYAREYREGWGETTDGSMYTNGNIYYGVKLDIGVNRGGPLFFTHFSFMGLDPRGLKDKYTTIDYYNTLRNIVRINYRYCLENPNNRRGYGPGCWGISVCEYPWGTYGAYEAIENHEDGTISPAGALGSFPYTPEESMNALRNYYRNYGSFLWGEYGFRDAFNLNENWCSNIYMGLNQGAITVMMENYRTGLIWNLFMKDKDIKQMKTKVFLP